MKIVKKLVLFALVAAQLVAVCFAHTATVKNSGENKYKSVRLTPEIYASAKENLGDIRVKDEAGRDVPYFINSKTVSQQSERQSYPLELIDAYIKDENYYFDYKAAQTGGQDIIATALRFETGSTNFAKQVQVFGSHDNKNWTLIQDDSIYKVEGSAKLVINFAGQQKYTHYRLKLGNNLERIAFDRAELEYSLYAVEQNYFVQQLNPEFVVEQSGQNTIVEISGVDNLKLNSIEIQTNSSFKRLVRVLGNKQDLYNLDLNGQVYRDLVFELDGDRAGVGGLSLYIENRDDQPIDVQGITVTYLADELVFEGVGDCTIEFGDDMLFTPGYDIVTYKEQILTGPIDRLEITGVKMIVPEPEPEPYDYQWVFNLVIIGVGVILGVVIVVSVAKKPKN